MKLLLSTLTFMLLWFAATAQSDSLKVTDLEDVNSARYISLAKQEKLPRFYSLRCESYDEKDREACAKEVLLQTLYSEVKYPKKARKMGEHGTVIVRFVVKKDGSIADLRVVRSVSPLLDEEALRAVATLDKWVPGEQKGETVDVNYSLPLKFAFSKSKK